MPYLKPLPQITEANRPFWDGLKRHEFLVPKCRDCGMFNWSPYPACRNCLSENQEWTRVSGNGAIYSFSVVHRAPGTFADDLPYVVAVVELDEKPMTMLAMGNMFGVNPDHIHIGMRVKTVYEDIPEEDMTMWRYAPA